MKKSFIILKIMVLGAVAGANGMEWLDDAYRFFPEVPFYQDPDEQFKHAIRDGCWHTVDAIISKSSDQNSQIELALKCAGEYNQLQIAQNLIEKYPHASTQDCLDLLLLEACGSWHNTFTRPWKEQQQYGKQQLELVKFALEKGANIECKPETPLDRASAFGCANIAWHLINEGAQVKASSFIAALSRDNASTGLTLLRTITQHEQKRILTAICSIKKGHLDGCLPFPRDIYQHLTLVLINQFTHEHMAQAKMVLDSIVVEEQNSPFGKDHFKSELNQIQSPACWDFSSKTVAMRFRCIVRPPEKEAAMEPKDKVSKV